MFGIAGIKLDRLLVMRRTVSAGMVVCTHGARCLWKWRRRYASFTLASRGWPTGVLDDRGEVDEVEREPGLESVTYRGRALPEPVT